MSPVIARQLIGPMESKPYRCFHLIRASPAGPPAQQRGPAERRARQAVFFHPAIAVRSRLGQGVHDRCEAYVFADGTVADADRARLAIHLPFPARLLSVLYRRGGDLSGRRADDDRFCPERAAGQPDERYRRLGRRAGRRRRIGAHRGRRQDCRDHHRPPDRPAHLAVSGGRGGNGGDGGNGGAGGDGGDAAPGFRTTAGSVRPGRPGQGGRGGDGGHGGGVPGKPGRNGVRREAPRAWSSRCRARPRPAGRAIPVLAAPVQRPASQVQRARTTPLG